MEKAGIVSLTQGVANIYLDVTAAQMAQTNAGTNYYGMATQTTAETTPQNHVLATISATGGNNDQVYECTMGYSMSVSQIEGSSKSAYGALEYEDAELVLNTIPTANSGNTATNIFGESLYGIKAHGPLSTISTVIIHGNTSLQITADLIMHNLNKSQNDLAELGANVSFNVASFNCNPVEVTLASNGVELIEENNQIHMEIGNDTTGLSNLNSNKIIIDNDLTNRQVDYKLSRTVSAVTSWSYYATPGGRSDTLLRTPLFTLINTDTRKLACSVTYGIETTGNMLSTVQNVSNATLDLTIGDRVFRKDNFPTQVTLTDVYDGNTNISLKLHITQDVAPLYDTNIQVKFTPISMSCGL